MSNIVPFDGSGKLPAYLKATNLPNVNADVVTAAPHPTISIKGKQFTVVRDGLRKTLMKPAPDEDEVAQKIEVAVLRANMASRIFYMKAFDEADTSAAPPDCWTMDGVNPSPNAQRKQASSCALCPHSVWGTGNVEKGTGRACSDTPRLAIATPDKLDDPYLLRVPPASIKNWKEAVKIAKQRNIPYNALVYRVSFDKDAASPVLLFKPVGLLDDDGYAAVNKEYDGDIVRAIVGLEEAARASALAAPPAAAPEVGADELDAALAARAAAAVVTKAKAPAPAPKPQVTPDELDAAAPAPAPAKAKAKPAAAPAPAADDDGDLLGGLDSLLGTPDD